MKKWLLCGIAAIMVAVITFLGQTAVDPEDFSGEWYSASGQQIYRFHNGIIYCDQYFVTLSDGSRISGAYSFSGNSVSLFALGIDGLESVKDLYLVENKDESFLCERKDGPGKIYFARHN